MGNKEFLKISAEQDKMMEEIYRLAANKTNLSMTEFWIIYFLHNSDKHLTQADICRIVMAPKQTVNSSVKLLVKKEIISLDAQNGKKNKTIYLTAKGAELARKTVGILYDLELQSAGCLTEEEKTTFLAVREKFVDTLKEKLTEKGLI